MPKSDSDSDRSRSRSRTRKNHRHRRSSHHHRSRSRHGRHHDPHHPANAPNFQVPYPNPYQVPYPPSYPAFHNPQYQFSHPPPPSPPPGPPPAAPSTKQHVTHPWEVPASVHISQVVEEPHSNAHGVNWHSPILPPATLPVPLAPKADVQQDSSSKELSLTSYTQSHLCGISIVAERDAAYAECKATVERIARQCRAKNRKFRDVEFDIDSDKDICLNNLQDRAVDEVPDVQRVPDIFPSPRVFYSGTSKSAEIAEGKLADGHLISALSAMTAVEGLVDRLCVARDEEVGIYGFIFHRDCYWVSVIIDDLLFIRLPKYESLSADEKILYDNKKDAFDATRRSPEALLFARPPGNSGETWMPLVEKAYAKLHGDYASITYGKAAQAVEDLTGGVSSIILCQDILDPDTFWTKELLCASRDRLFTCCYSVLSGTRSGTTNPPIGGLVGGLSYSVVRSVEVKGKRFVVMRSAWGHFGGTWKGPWSDGSKEWTTEWLACLSDIGYSLGGGGGEFVMEYKDFLDVWTEVHRTLIFDSSWIMSSLWLHVPFPVQTLETYSFGHMTFTFSLSVSSPAVVVLSTYDISFFEDLGGFSSWRFDFVLARIGPEGETEIVTESSCADALARSVSVELDMLEKGDYVDYIKNGLKNGWNRRKAARILTERAKGQSIAANYKPDPSLLPTPASAILKNRDRLEADKKILSAAAQNVKDFPRHEGVGIGSINGGDTITVTTKTSTTTRITQKRTRLDQAETGPDPPFSSTNFPPGPTQVIQPQNVQPLSPMIVAPSANPIIIPPPQALPPPLPSLPRLTVDDYLFQLQEDDSTVFGLKVQ
ncbi:hypothetical protein D9613_006504 [Agrocybe pediades]|uniref:Calpain catalytic domain-containing protein n=1 Tax=Agrocybe pediades TaxID=84607 RepID=A0A8H4QHF7_9AGAR|nr:hypothetical protein D9613_006504 [Agrocybe pediades]